MSGAGQPVIPLYVLDFSVVKPMPEPKTLGPYELKELLGHGGMGTVYRATDTIHHRDVAVKVVSPGFATSEGFRDRFEAEIRSLERLRHPHIVELLGFGEQDGFLFLAMELVEGGSLHEQLAEGRRFSWQEVVRIAIDLSAALKHAHDHGIIHRDIKPANLMVDDDGLVKLTDFGIAKLFGGAQLTIAGGVVGTADFMAPEQAEGKAATVRSDLYSLGSVMYTLLAGKPPFRGKSVPDVMYKVRFEPHVPISRYVPDLPPGLEDCIDRLLEKSPAERIPTTVALAKRLQAIAHGLPPATSHSPAPLRDEPEPSRTMPDPIATRDRLSPASEVASSGDPTETIEMSLAGDEFASCAPSAAENATRGEGKEVSLRGTSLEADSTRSDKPSGSTFTVVDERYRRKRFEQERESPWGIAGRWLMLIAALVGLYFGFRQLTRPATADQLYRRIEEAAAQGSDELASQGRQMAEFVQRYASDPRSPRVSQWLKATELAALERRLEARLKRKIVDSPASPLEDSLLEAIRWESISASESRKRFEAIVALYGEVRDLLESDREYLDFARVKVQRLSNALEAEAALHEPMLRQWIETAEGQPAETAMATWQRIVDLYHDKPWASAYVHKARQHLQAARP